ncbi:PepSY-associated TM helix domain-containing protein [Limibacter armeniacum]|uniref:PepSY-associated TM helix domain-containing protein n=1 Tax=Limibacter armeniacum TaxID=466084 RepID=UPI002FE53F74
MKQNRLRKFLVDIHLWLGVGSGIILFIVCFTGTVMVYQDEILDLINGDQHTVTVTDGSSKVTIDQLIQKIESEEGKAVTGLSIPSETNEAYTFTLAPNEGERRGKRISVDPYNGEVLPHIDQAGRDFFRVMFRLHRWLLLDSKIGRPIVGVATLIFVVLCLTGLYLWVPINWKSWKQGFKVKTSGNWYRLNYDLHNTLGFYALGLLLVMSLTGLCWSFGWYRDALSVVLGDKVFNRGGGKPTEIALSEDIKPLSMEQLLAKANQTFDYEGNISLRLPNDSNHPVTVMKQPTAWYKPKAYDKLEIHPQTAEIVSVSRFGDKHLGQKISSLIKPLHLGDVYGQVSKFFYFIASLIATSLPITGVIIWIKQLQISKRKKLKKAKQQVTIA